MAKPFNDRNVQYFLILGNVSRLQYPTPGRGTDHALFQLPESVLRHRPGENWKPVKDLIHSHIHSANREYGRIDIADGIAVCRLHDMEQRREAYGMDECLSLARGREADCAVDAIQGLCWRGSTLKAWLCEKRGPVMEQSAGPIDPWTGNVIPAPGHLMRMTPSLARRIGCTVFPQPLPSPPLQPQLSGMVIPPSLANTAMSPSYTVPSKSKPASAHSLQIGKRFPTMTPPLSQTSRSSSISANSTSLPQDAAHARSGEDPCLPCTPHAAQTAISSGRTSASGSSSVLAAPYHLPASLFEQCSSPSHTLGFTGYNKIKIQNFHPKASADDIDHFLECACQLKTVRRKTCNGNGRSPRAFVTFGTDEEAEIAVQKLHGVVVGGRKLKVNLDLQRIGQPFADTGYPSTWREHNPSSERQAGAGKPLPMATVRKETVSRPAYKGPVIIDGSQA